MDKNVKAEILLVRVHMNVIYLMLVGSCFTHCSLGAFYTICMSLLFTLIYSITMLNGCIQSSIFFFQLWVTLIDSFTTNFQTLDISMTNYYFHLTFHFV
jgi:hypothetical protein